MKNQMKKMMFMACLVLFALTACADDDLPIRTNQLPRNAQQFLTQYFRGVEVSYAKQDDEGFDKSYEVVFVDGNKVEFRRDGEWKSIAVTDEFPTLSCPVPSSTLYASIMPASIFVRSSAIATAMKSSSPAG